MDNDKILSLCVSIINNNGMRLLFRIADVNENGTFVPFKIDHTQNKEEYNIDTIFRPRYLVPDEGILQLIEWESYFDEEKQRFQQSAETYDTSVRWIEYIRLDAVKSVEQFRTAMIIGIDVALDDDHGYLVEISKTGANEYMCAYFEASDFKQRPNGLYALDERVYKLDVYTVRDGEFTDALTRFIPGFIRQYYLHFNLPNKAGTILVRDPSEIVKNVIVKRINGCAAGLSKADKNTVRNFLRDCDTSSITDIIIDKLRCSESEAQTFLSDFIKHCNEYFADEDFLQGTLLDFIGSNNIIATKYRLEIKDEWERDFQAEMQKSYDELSELDSKNKRAMAEYNQTIDLKTKIEADLASLQNDYDEKLRLAGDIDKQIREKITSAKGNLADFFSEYAVFSTHSASQTSPSTGNVATSTYVAGRTFSADYETIKIGELLEYLSDNLTTIGVDYDKASVLASYLIAAYALKIPLILAGYGAVEIADAVSITLYNKTADRLYVKNENFVDIQCNGEVVIAYDAFGCIDKVLETTKGRFVCFVAQTSEEMSIEPRSIYNHALPLFPEYFITGENEANELLGCVMQDEILLEGGKTSGSIKTVLPSYCLPKLAYSRTKKLLEVAQDFYGRYDKNDVFMLQVMPIMLSLSMREQLIELISQKYTNTAGAFRLIGVNDESDAS